MKFELYVSRDAENELEELMPLLEGKRLDVYLANLKKGERMLLSSSYGKEVYFVRDGITIGHFEVEKYSIHAGEKVELESQHQTLQFNYRDLYYSTASLVEKINAFLMR